MEAKARGKSRMEEEQKSIEEMNKLDKEISINVYEDSNVNSLD